MRKSCAIIFSVVMLIFACILALPASAAEATSSTMVAKAIYGTPTIDGVADDIWDDAEIHYLNHVYFDDKVTPPSITRFRSMWDEDYIYFLVDVKDETMGDKDWEELMLGSNLWKRDGISFTFAPHYNRTETATVTQPSFWYILGAYGSPANFNYPYVPQNVWISEDDGATKKFAISYYTDNTSGAKYGYTIECKVNLAAVHNTIQMAAGTKIGFDIQNNNNNYNSGSGTRNYGMTWSGFSTSYKNDAHKGTIEFLAKGVKFNNSAEALEWTSTLPSQELEPQPINNAEEFAAMLPYGKYYLNSDITITTSYAYDGLMGAFTGTLDGNGKTVTVSAPMFANLCGTVKNLTIKGEIVSANDAGAVAAISTDGCTVENVVNNANITVVKKEYTHSCAGGIVGYDYGDKRVSTYTNVINNGNIYSESSAEENAKPRAGGIAAMADNAIFIRCINNGEITAKGDLSMAAGIAARLAQAPAGTNTAEAYYCVNNGKITATDSKNNTTSTDAAGIFAYIGVKSNIAYYRVYGCVNNGDIYGSNRASGMVGYVYGSNASQFVDVEFCVNTGNITYGKPLVDGAESVAYGSYFVAYTNSPYTTIKYNISTGTCKPASFAVASNQAFISLSSADFMRYDIFDNYLLAKSAADYRWTFWTNDANFATYPNNRQPVSYGIENGLFTIVSAEEMASGKIAYALNQASKGNEGGYCFYQTLGVDAVPTPMNTSKEVFCVGGVYINSDVKLSIDKFNLSLKDSIYLKYAVTAKNASNVKLLIWTAPQDEYVLGTQNETLTSTGTAGGMLVFDYTKLTARKMTDVVYARAYAEVDGKIVYSDVRSYSILEYIYTKLGYIGNSPTTDAKLISLLELMLEYGAAAQDYQGYNLNRLATDTYYQITVNGGVLADGTTSGLFKEGDSITLIAPATNSAGEKFSHWQDSTGAVVTATPEVGAKNETYTAVYANYSIGLEYVLINGGTEYSVKSRGTCTDTEIVIPSTHEGKPVTSIGYEAFYKCTDITSIEIPEGVKSIGDRAFQGCSALTSIVIPDSVTDITSYMLCRCTALKSVTIGKNVKSIGEYAFWESQNIESITVSADNATYYSSGNCLIQKSTQALVVGCKTSVIPSGVKIIYKNAFDTCTGLTSIIIPDSVTSIEKYAFYRCTGLESVTMGNGIKTIGEYAFYECSKLADITIPDGVTSIGQYAFSYCAKLESIEIPDSVTGILGACAFDHCTGLKSAVIGNGVEAIGAYTFSACTGLESVVIGNGVKIIGDGAFMGCIGLTDITLPDGLTAIYECPFAGCSGLESITIGSGVESIGADAFKSCDSLTTVIYKGTQEEWLAIDIKATGNDSLLNANIIFSDVAEGSQGLQYTLINNGTEYSVSDIGTCADKDIVIPATHEGKPVTDIAADAFYECEDITSVKIPDGVTSIGYAAFANCTNLASITIPDSVTSISYYAFSSCGITNVKLPNGLTKINECLFYNSSALVSVEIPASVTSIDRSAFYGCSSLEEVKLSDNVKSIGDSAFQFCSSLKSVTFGAGIESIGESAFSRCSGLESIEIPENVTSIDQGAFEFCFGLTSVEIPGSIVSISKNAFHGCIGLTSVTIGDGVESIGKYAFADCTKLTSIKMADSVTSVGDYAFSGCTALVDVTVGSGVKTIGAYAFSQCGKLTSITIPNSVTSIASGTFYRASKLTTVTYKGTQEEWAQINIGTTDNSSFLNANIVFSDFVEET